MMVCIPPPFFLHLSYHCKAISARDIFYGSSPKQSFKTSLRKSQASHNDTELVLKLILKSCVKATEAGVQGRA